MNAAFREALVTWYQGNARELPWRSRPTPYRVWISEIMLQQTRVEAVRGHFARFIKRFPNVRRLAAADLEQVLEAWSGLGYYRRARMLHAAAREIVARHGGRFPRRMEDVIALPGIGRYTAGAILSIAFGQPQPIVDGNVMRVYARLAAEPAPGKSAWTFAEAHVTRGASEGHAPSALNQALMELGATVCTPANPRCAECPVRRQCRGRSDPAAYPAARPRAKAQNVIYSLIAPHDARGRVLLVRRAAGDKQSLLPAGLWELPAPGTIKLTPRGEPATVRHTIMNFRLELTAQPGSGAARAGKNRRWFTQDQAAAAAMSSATRKLLDTLWQARP